MHILYLENPKNLKPKLKFLEKKLNIKLTLKGRNLVLSGNELLEYEAYQIIEAIDKGFSIKTALLLKDENFVFESINIKNLTKRHNLSQIRARIIGRKGKTLKVLKELTDCDIILKNNQVYIIGSAEKIKDALLGIKKLIQGSKQSSTYSYLERARKHPMPLDLGLKVKKK